MIGWNLAVQSFPCRVSIWILPRSIRAPTRYPSILISWEPGVALGRAIQQRGELGGDEVGERGGRPAGH